MAKAKILVVAMDSMVRAALQRALQAEEDWELAFAATAADALAQLSEPVPHLVLAVDGDGLDAFRFLETVRTVQPAVLRLIVVEHADLERAVEAVRAKLAYRFVVKPWDVHTLRVDLRRAVLQACRSREKT